MAQKNIKSELILLQLALFLAAPIFRSTVRLRIVYSPSSEWFAWTFTTHNAIVRYKPSDTKNVLVGAIHESPEKAFSCGRRGTACGG